MSSFSDRVNGFLGLAGNTGNTITDFAGGAITKTVNPLLGTSKTTTTTAAADNSKNDALARNLIIVAVAVVIIGALYLMFGRKKGSTQPATT